MKTTLCLFLSIVAMLSARAADDLSAALQKGLFEEEGNQNLEAAIQAYQALIALHDQDRKLAATAVFRLGECYRKLGRTNDAVVQYQRVLAGFSDQSTLATLSRQNLVGLGVAAKAAASTDPDSSAQRQLLLQNLATQQIEAASIVALADRLKSMDMPELRKVLPTVSPDALLTRLLESENQIEQKIAALGNTMAPEHPSMREQVNARKTVERQIDERIDGILAGLQLKANAAQSQIKSLEMALSAHDATSGAPSGDRLDQATRARLKEMLQEELQLAEKLLAEQEKKIQVGVLSPGENLRFERDALGLRRQLIALDGLESAGARKQWRDLLLKEIELGEAAARNEKLKLDVGRSVASEVARLQRDVLTLKREMIEFDARPAAVAASASTASPSMTSEEEEEIRKIQTLIRNSPDLINAPSANSTPLHLAAIKGQLVVARFLLDNRAEVDRRSNEGRTALALACEQGHRAMAELLLSRGANPNAVDQYLETPLHIAAKKGFVSVAEVLLQHKASLEARNKSGETPIHKAVEAGQSAMMEALRSAGANVNAPRDSGETPLHVAASRDDADMVARLVKHGADLEAKDKQGETPLWQRLLRTGPPRSSYPDPAMIVRLLLEKGARADGVVDGWTLTHRAVVLNSPEILAMVMAHGAAPDLRNTDGVTPLQLAVLDGKNPAMVPMLVKAGSDANAPINPGGSTRTRIGANRTAGFGNFPQQDVTVSSFPPLLVAIWKGELSMTEALLTNGAIVNVADPQGNTALMYAGYQSRELLDLVLRHKPDLDTVEPRYALTALHKAVGQKNTSTVEALLKAGAKVNPVEKRGQTPLHFAAQNGDVDIAALLLQHGANPNAFNADGRLPLDYVRTDRQPADAKMSELKALLLKHGADESLLRRRSITVTRRSANYEEAIFKRGTNEFNRFSLYELIARLYSNTGGNPKERLFPDLNQIAIERLQAGSGTRQILVDLEALAANDSCTNDLWLEWGDIIEIREKEHPLNATWPGLDGTLATNISKCLGRSMELIIKGRTNRIARPAIAVASARIGGPQFAAGFIEGFSINQEYCGLAAVLGSSGLLLTTSDLSRVRVTRRDGESGKVQEWILDETKPDWPTDFWLRDGDIIEVPEKDPNAPAEAASSDSVTFDVQPIRSIPARTVRPPVVEPR